MHVALEIWRESGCCSSRSNITLSMGKLQSLGVHRKAAYSALKRLEAVKLITVERRRGCLPRITILDLNSSDGAR